MEVDLSPEAEQRFRYSHFHKYSTFAQANLLNAGLPQPTLVPDPTVILEWAEPKFFGFLDDLLAANPVTNDYAIGSYQDGYIVYAPGFLGNNLEFLILERTATESFLDTVSSETTTGNKIAVNGSFYDFASGKGYSDAMLGPMAAADIVPIGAVYKGGVALSGTRSSPEGFFTQADGGGFSFGQGEASAGEGLSGLTPILLFNSTYNKVWKYGEQNVYDSSLPAGANAPGTGDPGTYGQHLLIRSNLQYAGQNSNASGKTIFAYHSGRDAVVFFCQEDFYYGGKNLDYLRDQLYLQGFDYAVGFDGSTSSLLYEYSTKKFLVTPSRYKYNSMKIGVIIRS